MQSLLGSFGPWLEKFRQSNPPVQQLERYEQQYEIYSEILKLCEAGDGQRSGELIILTIIDCYSIHQNITNRSLSQISLSQIFPKIPSVEFSNSNL